MIHIKMEFTSEIAVLQSALQLVNQRSNLRAFTKQSSTPSTKTASDVVEEACSGIYFKSTSEDYNTKKLQMTVVLLYKVLLADCVYDGGNESRKNGEDSLETWNVILHGLPQLSWHFVFDVIDNSGLWQQVFKLLPNLPNIFAVRMLQELLDYLMIPCRSMDIKLLSVVLTYVSLHWQSPIYDQSTNQKDCVQLKRRTVSKKYVYSGKLSEDLLLTRLPSVRDVTREELCNLVSTMLSSSQEVTKLEVADRTSLALAKLSLCHMVVSLCSGHAWILSPIHDNYDGNEKAQYPNPLAVIQNILLTGDESEEEVLRVLISEFRRSDLPLQMKKVIIHASEVSPKPNQLMLDGLFRPDEMLFDELQHFDVDLLLSNRQTKIYQCLWKDICKQLILNEHSLLKGIVGDSLLDSQSAMIARILDGFKPHVRRIQEDREKDKLVWQQSEQKLTKTLVILRYQLPGAQEYLIWLLDIRDISIVTHPRWLEAVLFGSSLLADPVVMMCAVRQLSWFNDTSMTQHYSSLKNLILKSLSSCDSETQNRMLQQLTVLYSSNELEKIFHLGESVKNDLRSTLNRLTTETLIDSFARLATICIQSPSQLVQAVVHCAVQNRGQVDTLVQVFRHLPAILQFNADDNKVLITTLIDITDHEDDMTEQGLRNVTSFCKQLLEPYTRVDDGGFQDPVLTPVQLLHHLVLPVVMPSTNADYKDHRKAFCYQMFRAAVQVFPQLLPRWSDLVSETRPVILLYVILGILDRFTTSGHVGDLDIGDDHWAYVDSLSRGEWLECAVALIETLQKHSYLTSDSDLLWLRSQLEECHWTTRFYCYSLYRGRASQVQLDIEIPHRMLELVTLPFRPSQLSYDGFLALFHFIIISDMTLNLAQGCLRKDLIYQMEPVLPKIILSMAVVLMRCTGTELCRLIKFLYHWFDDGDDMKGMISDDKDTSACVCCCLIIKLVLKLIISGSHKDSSIYSWTNLAVTLTFAIKTVILDTASEPTALNDLCRCFIIVCNMLSDWPDPDSAQHLLTLGLDVIGQFDVNLQQYNKSSGSETVNQIHETIAVLKYECSDLVTAELREPLLKVLQSINL